MYWQTSRLQYNLQGVGVSQKAPSDYYSSRSLCIQYSTQVRSQQACVVIGSGLLFPVIYSGFVGTEDVIVGMFVVCQQ